MENLGELWTNILDIGYGVRNSNRSGLDSWQPLKTTYGKYYVKGYESGIPILEETKFLSDGRYVIGTDKKDHTDSKFEINGKILDNQVEKYHFLIQHFRIPILGNYKLPILKILQIAYNAGQFKASVEKGEYSTDIVNFYRANNLGSIETYLDKKFIRIVPEKNMTGGHSSDIYFAKYLKYKRKYMELANNTH